MEELFRYGKGGKAPVDPMPMIQRLSLSLALTLNWGVRIASQEEDMFDEITHVEEEISDSEVPLVTSRTISLCYA